MRTKQGALWLATIIAAGCGPADYCEEALDKLVGECGFGDGASLPLGNPNGECKDELECSAECVVDSDCDDIAEADDNSYTKCLGKCL